MCYCRFVCFDFTLTPFGRHNCATVFYPLAVRCLILAGRTVSSLVSSSSFATRLISWAPAQGFHADWHSVYWFFLSASLSWAFVAMPLFSSLFLGQWLLLGWVCAINISSKSVTLTSGLTCLITEISATFCASFLYVYKTFYLSLFKYENSTFSLAFAIVFVIFYLFVIPRGWVETNCNYLFKANDFT